MPTGACTTSRTPARPTTGTDRDRSTSEQPSTSSSHRRSRRRPPLIKAGRSSAVPSTSTRSRTDPHPRIISPSWPWISSPKARRTQPCRRSPVLTTTSPCRSRPAPLGRPGHSHHGDSIYKRFWIRQHQLLRRSPPMLDRPHQPRHRRPRCPADLPRNAGLERLMPGHVFSRARLESAARAQSVTIGRGDILLLRTGHLAWYYSLHDKAAFRFGLMSSSGSTT
jgi:hypothetical protein